MTKNEIWKLIDYLNGISESHPQGKIRTIIDYGDVNLQIQFYIGEMFIGSSPGLISTIEIKKSDFIFDEIIKDIIDSKIDEIKKLGVLPEFENKWIEVPLENYGE